MPAGIRQLRGREARKARDAAREGSGSLARRGTAGVAAGVVLTCLLIAQTASAQTSLAGKAQAAGSSAPAAGTSLAGTSVAGTAVPWAGFAGNAQHTAVTSTPAQPLTRIRWRAKVDQAAVVQHKVLTTHYGSPMITRANTVLVPTRISAKAGFRVIAYSGRSGVRRWSLATDYRPVPRASNSFEFMPPLPAVLTTGNILAVAGAGGTVLMRHQANNPSGAVQRRVFYGAAEWRAHRAAFDKAVRITTPLTAGPDGSVYFGFTVSGKTPTRLSSGIARIAANGHATWTSATAAARSKTVNGVAISCAPALSPDGKTVYVAVTSGDLDSSGFLVGLDAKTLKPHFRTMLKDPVSGQPAMIDDSSSASPTVGPDGDVYYGVQENPSPNHDGRGWLLHFNASLTKTKTPGSFGWDNTVSVLPANAVPGYRGNSPYLLVSKYNNYLNVGPHGDGRNRVAVLDPRASQKDPYASVRTMKAVKTILSPVHVPGERAGARYEWCINSAVVDTADDSVFVNSEAGILYRWDLASNTLAGKIRLNIPRTEAYTPTVVGPDGTVYAINNATLYAIGR